MKQYLFAKLSLFAVVFLMFAGSANRALAFDGSVLEAGNSYYLYNLYQAKFLTYGNAWGTQCSVSRTNPLLCTIKASESGYLINTHFQPSTGSYNASFDNYVMLAEYNEQSVAAVNSKWSDDASSDRGGSVFTFTKLANGNYNIVASNGTALMFGAGTACVMGSLTEGFNASKAEWLLVSPEEYAAYLAKKRFTAAAYNVDGMPQNLKIGSLKIDAITLNPDCKGEAGGKAIGNKFKTSGYDFIALSEDFNFHSNIWDAAWNNGTNDASGYSYNATEHKGSLVYYVGLGTKYLAKETLFDTDGLCMFFKTSTTTVSGETSTKWVEHYGYKDDGADGLINKGYRYAVIKINNELEVDAYYVHMDAEDSPGDNAARETQFRQLASAIIASDNKRPILIMGDTNSRYTRDRLKSVIFDAINADARFTMKDPWVDFGREGIYPAYNADAITAGDKGYLEGEVVDKIFYINNSKCNYRIVAESYFQDLSFVDDSGESLADHWPCVVEFSYHVYDPETDDEKNTLPRYSWVGEDPTAGGIYYIYHPYTGKFLTHDEKTLDAEFKTETQWTITKKSVSNNVYTVNMQSGGYSFNLAKEGGSAIPTLRQDDTQTIEMSKSGTNTDLNAFKLRRTANPARYFNFDGKVYTGAENTGPENDWVFISVDQYNKKKPNDYISEGVHHYEGIYVNRPTITVPAPVTGSDQNVYVVDLTKATGVGIASISVDVTNNPNTIILGKSGDCANTVNFVDVEIGKCANLTLTDGYPLYIPQNDDFTALQTNYTRNVTNAWGTIVMPFALTSDDNILYYKLDSKEGAQMNFVEVAALAANEPGVFKCNATGEVPFISGRTIVSSTPATPSAPTSLYDWTIYGTYTQQIFTADNGIEDHYYYISKNKFYTATSKITMNPFRAYYITETPGVKAFSLNVADNATNIASVEKAYPTMSIKSNKGSISIKSNENKSVVIFDTVGRMVSKCNLKQNESATIALPSGIYVVNNQKVIVK